MAHLEAVFPFTPIFISDQNLFSAELFNMSAQSNSAYAGVLTRPVIKKEEIVGKKTSQRNKSPIVSLISGGVAGAIEATATVSVTRKRYSARLR
jgi:hypothetical protein